MNILIVDDNSERMNNLISQIDWKFMGFKNIYSASSVNEAKDFFKNDEVLILICKMEMQPESGLELVRWLQKKNNPSTVIFISEKFDYNSAKEAISLNCSTILSCPIDISVLNEAIENAASEYRKNQFATLNIHEEFWRMFLNKELSLDKDGLTEYFRENNIQYNYDDIFMSVMIDYYSYELTDSLEIKYYFPTYNEQTTYIKNAFKDVFAGNLNPTDCFLCKDRYSSRYIIFFRVNDSSRIALIERDLNTLKEKVFEETKHYLNIFMVNPFSLVSAKKNKYAQATLLKYCLNYKNTVIRLTEIKIPDKRPTSSFDYTAISILLENNNYEQLEDICLSYLTKNFSAPISDYIALHEYIDYFYQNILAFLHNKNIIFDYAFNSKTLSNLYQNATRSYYDACIFIKYVIGLTERYLSSLDESASISKTITDYINKHYSEDISRTTLKDLFFFNPDYTSRLYKKETGVSFKQALINKRIEEACKLLANSDMAINTISAKIGYDNYSYFTRLFKKETGLTPVEYRATAP